MAEQVAQTSVHRHAILLTILLLLLPAIALPSLVPDSRAGTIYKPHLEILVDGNSGFSQSNGVTGGSGTSKDPFIISGWDIAGQSTAIQVQHTTAYLVIRNVSLHSNANGLHLIGVSHGRVESSSFTGNGNGVAIDGSTHIIVANNNMTGNGDGVVVDYGPSSPTASSDVTIVSNNISNGEFGIFGGGSPGSSSQYGTNITSNRIWSNSLAGIATFATNNLVANNNITSNGDGIDLTGSTNFIDSKPLPAGVIVGNYLARNNRGILSGIGVTLEDNIFVQNGFEIAGGGSNLSAFYDSHTIPPTNMIDGKPLLYLSNCNGARIDGQAAGEIVVGSCDNVELANLELQNSHSPAIQMGFVHNVTMTNVTFTNNLQGLRVERSNGVGVFQSNFFSNNDTALSIQDSGNITIRESSFTSNLAPPVVLSRVGNLAFVNNTVSETSGFYADGIEISDSASIFIAGNLVRMNGGTGLALERVGNATLFRNMIVDNGGSGVTLTSGDIFNMTENTLLNNYSGLDIHFANIFHMGGIPGVFNAIVYHNNFVLNKGYQGSHDNNTFPAMDNGYPSGGNYWSDFTGVDNCSGPYQNICNGPDGIGDTPYKGLVAWVGGGEVGPWRGINTVFDHYPLMKPFGVFSLDKTPPSWPSGAALTYSNPGRTSVLLHWPAATDDTWVQDYRIYQNGTLLTKLPSSIHNYNVTGLAPGTSYLFRVEADDVAGNPSVTGPSVIVTTGNGPPGGSSQQPPNGLMGIIASILSQNLPFAILGAIVVVVIGTIPILRRSRRGRFTPTAGHPH